MSRFGDGLKTKLFLLFFYLALTGAAFGSSYWVSFTQVNFTGTYSNYSYIMQIDNLGNVTMAPKLIHNNNWTIGPEITTLSNKSSRNLHVWIGFTGGNIMHTLIGKSLFSATTLKSIPIAFLIDSSLQSPAAGGFLAAVAGTPAYAWAYGVDSNGAFTGDGWGLSPRTRRTNFFLGLSADGLMVIGSTIAGKSLQLYAQPLKPNGLPDGDPAVAAQDGGNITPDVSNVVANNHRLVVFRSLQSSAVPIPGSPWVFNYGAPPDPAPTAPVSLQMIDATTGQRVGAVKSIVPDSLSFMFPFQSLAIDPMGHFILYGAVSEGKGNSNLCDDLYYQALDATGNASGSPKKVLACTATTGGIYGIDLLQN